MMAFSTLVIWAAIALAAVVSLIGLATLVISAYRYRNEKRRRELRPEMTNELFSRLNDDDPDWETWVTGLSSVEQDAARSATERLLRQLRGAERRELGRLAAALGIDRERIGRDVESGELYRTLRALTWLALVEYPSVVNRAIQHCTGDRAVRTALARVLYENNDPRASREGIDLLLDEGVEPLSVFGLDTLYRIVRQDPTYLLNLAEERHEKWDDRMLLQVLLVIRHGRSGVGPASIEWVTDCVDRDPEVLAEALLLLAEYGWSPQIREVIDLTEFTRHPDPEVRRAAYIAFGEWGKIDGLIDPLSEETDDLARLVGIRVLEANGCTELDHTSEAFDRTRRWIVAERRAARGLT
ncbi:hypothetical protein C491_13617 [Natronococcus amylolyticus DSM 10524]|uniref:HEAT repeat domain-containing protein n=1 Tax=Natronococcus amylolyticus DSM 10524 TaxID=1227497 RepID=L9X600_9EURY|nr:hypothetical protein [Natronococcus amylolyticus]ELY55993.1 hypothetical protein C491_13617 [Natronococcus amylolyticus DSM 10524]